MNGEHGNPPNCKLRVDRSIGVRDRLGH